VKPLQKTMSRIRYLSREWLTGFASLLPNDVLSTRLRVLIYRACGLGIASDALVYRNVLLLGKVSVGSGSSISNNSSINGAAAGVHIGSDVMIAPGCCIVAFDHGMQMGEVPMIRQPLVEAAITIGDGAWIAANCTITKGVRVGRGAIVAANSVVTRDVDDFTIVGGVPARYIKSRIG
jgi:acetyltransferase-like isoleucine patch superfamily enzyme